ncbi:hypothetical protein OUZ56_013792 [Daphnia magna]|uniref:Uncharacterized protein n=1 Tax=Daphnia magna TaxID=35525 RepID=A0ABQ9Z6Y7_9CRUS|nr:hypothetical protein OUZ56_013792 [Daphnia magna]
MGNQLSNIPRDRSSLANCIIKPIKKNLKPKEPFLLEGTFIGSPLQRFVQHNPFLFYFWSSLYCSVAICVGFLGRENTLIGSPDVQHNRDPLLERRKPSTYSTGYVAACKLVS